MDWGGWVGFVSRGGDIQQFKSKGGGKQVLFSYRTNFRDPIMGVRKGYGGMLGTGIRVSTQSGMWGILVVIGATRTT